MPDREKVIYDLERCICHVPDACRDCSKYNAEGILAMTCMESLMNDALELLKERKPRVMPLDELTEIYVEFKGNAYPVRLTMFDLSTIIMYMEDGICRLWAGKPTDEQREAAKWE